MDPCTVLLKTYDRTKLNKAISDLTEAESETYLPDIIYIKYDYSGYQDIWRQLAPLLPKACQSGPWKRKQVYRMGIKN